MLSHLAVIFISLVSATLADTSYDSTTTITLTPEITMTTTIGYIEEIFETAYIYTNSYSSLTTTTATGSTRYVLATGTPFHTVSSSASDETDVESSTSTSPGSAISAAASDVELEVSSAISTSSSFGSSSSTSSAVSISEVSKSTQAYSSMTYPSFSALSNAVAAFSESTSSIPKGDYSTSTSATTTTFHDGSSAVIEYVVLYTQDC